MAHYIGLAHKDEDSAFGVQFPDIPGCFAAADADEDLIAQSAEALSLWSEDAAMPAPRRIQDIIALPEVTAELAAGAFLISVPHAENGTRVVAANISVEQAMLKAIDAEAKRRKLTRSAFLVQAARNEMMR